MRESALSRYPFQALTLDCGNHWPGGPVNQKIHWPPKKPTGPPKTCNDPNVFAAGIYDFTREVADFCTLGLVYTRRMPVQRAALCIRNFPSQYRTHFRGLSGHNAGRFNATVFISMLSGGRAGVSINSPGAANTSLLASIVRAQTMPSSRERCTCSGVWRSVTIPY